MKKFVCVCFAMVMVVIMTNVAFADYWDEKTIEWLETNTKEWCEQNGYEDWIDGSKIKDGCGLGCAVITKDHNVFYDAKPDTITSPVYAERAKDLLGIELHDIMIIHYGQEGGYDIYRVIIRFAEGITVGDDTIYGEDAFVRFYN